MRAEIFAKNIAALLEINREKTGENIRQFAERLGLPYGWLRRISTAGISQENKRTLPYLHQLAAELNLRDYRDLWEQIPDELDAQDILEALRENYPAQWHLYMAYVCKYHLSANAEIREWVRMNAAVRMSVVQAAEEWADWISNTFEVVVKPEDISGVAEGTKETREGQANAPEEEKKVEDWKKVLEVEEEKAEEISVGGWEDMLDLMEGEEDLEEES